ADQLRARLTNEPQLPARPWDRWPSAPRSGVRGLRAILVGSAALLVIAIAGSLALVGLSGRPAATTNPQWLLTSEQLISAVNATSTDTHNVGRTVVAQVSLVIARSDCGSGACAPIYTL